MEIIDHASVQYGDARGTIAIDSHGGGELATFARDHGVPVGYFPVGFQVSAIDVSPAGSLTGMISCTFFAVEKVSEADELPTILQACDEDNPLLVHAFDAKVDPAELPRYIKRLEIVVKTRAVNDISFGILE